MSLLHQNRSFTVRDYLFIAVGLLGLFGFFMTYGSQDPRSMADISADSQSATLKAAEIANTLGYSSGNYQTEAHFGFNRRLLDSLQYHIGRPEMISAFSGSNISNIYPYYWQVRFTRESSGEEQREIEIGQGPEGRRVEMDERSFIIRLDQQGRWIEMDNEFELLPDQPVNRKALREAFESDSTLSLWNSVPDSAWDGILSFDIVGGYDDSPISAEEEGEQDEVDSAHEFTRDEVLRLAAWHINQSGWELDRFEVQNIQVETIQSATITRIRYHSSEPVFGQDVALDAVVMPTGALIGLKASYFRPNVASNQFPPIWEVTTVGLIFLFAIASIVIFYFRMRARAVDTKSALVVSVLTGFIVPVVIFLNQAFEIELMDDGTTWMELAGLGFSMGIIGALASIGFFVISSISDSITRQHWSSKLDCYDYIRQGMFFNKPVGEALVRSVVLTFIVAGFWSTLLWVFPNLYMSTSEPFLDYEVLWPPLYLIFDNLWYSLLIVKGIFMVVGSQVYAQTQNVWLASMAMVFSTAVVGPLPFSIGPPMQQFIVFLILGAVLTLIYLKWDILTLFLTHFLLTALLVSSGGWVAEGTPDGYVFLSFVILLLFIVMGGTLSIVKGKEEKALPSYVPEYVEELAQEERIKQELQIARDVQQSFLPAQTPAFGTLDLAAICMPAYETGGDYYDFIQLDDHRVAVAIGDVSGKGIQAAFYMTFTKGILHSLCRETESPAELLIKANKLFYDNARRGTFISLIYGILDTREKTFRFARAGHNPILYIKGESGKMELLQPNGLGLGLTKNSSFDVNIQETTLHLKGGDILVLYTDGIVEAVNTAHQFYGTDRLMKLLTEKGKSSANEILSTMVNDVTRFAGQAKQHDDMTVMILKLNGEN